MQPYTPSLARLAHLARRDAELLADVLSGYMEDTQVDDIQLAAYLACPVHMSATIHRRFAYGHAQRHSSVWTYKKSLRISALH